MCASDHGDDANDTTGDHEERMHLKEKKGRHCHCRLCVDIVVCIVCCRRDFVLCGVDWLHAIVFVCFDMISDSVRSFFHPSSNTSPATGASNDACVARLVWRVRSMKQLSMQIPNGDPWPRPASAGHHACETM